MKTFLFFLWTAWYLTGAPTPTAAAEPAQEDSVRKYRFLAKDAREKQDTEDALRYYAEYLKYQPDDPKAYFWIGELNYDKQDFPAAHRAFGQALALDSLHINSNFRLAEVFRLEGQADSASFYLDRLLRLKPDDPTYLELQRKLAELYYTQQNFPLALRHYLRFVESDSSRQDPLLVELIADLYEGQEEPARALEWRQRLLRAGTGADSTGSASANRVPLLDKMAELQVKAGDTKAALGTLAQLVQLDTLNRYGYYSRYVQIAEKGGDQVARLRGLEGMAQANAKDPEPPLKLAESYLNAGDPKTAERWVQRGLRADPRNAHLQLLKGDCLARQNQEDQAIAAYELAKTDPAWAGVAQQRIWQLRPPESQEEKLKREFFGKNKGATQEAQTKQ